MNTLNIDQGLYLIDLDQHLVGFRNFIGSWVFIGDYTFVVDVGPAATVKKLARSLKDLGVERPDYVLLTHIHLDHAGGIGQFTEFFPETKVVCHERAIEHLVKPEKLWEATKQTLGHIATAYGEIKPISEKKITSSYEFQAEGFKAISTPGHAVHHVSYVYDKYLFAGEVGGVFCPVNDQIYQRPATPPRFYLEEALESIDTLLKLGKKEICFGHFGIHKDSEQILKGHRKQLTFWKEVIAGQIKGSSHMGDLIDRCMSKLLTVDELLKPYNLLDDDIRERENYFVRNSMKGYIGYINDINDSSLPRDGETLFQL